MPLARAVVLAPVILVALAVAARAQVACPACQREAAPEFRFCPYDGAELPLPGCPTCRRPMESDWSFCPWDGARLGAPRAPSRSPEPGAAAPAAPPAAPLPPPPPLGTEPAAPAPSEAPSNPLGVVEALFRAIEQGDVARIRALYRWPAFFPAEAAEGADALDAAVARYVDHVIAAVRPTLAGRRRVPVKVKLGEGTATIGLGLEDRRTGERVADYEVTLAHDPSGWKIVAIAP